MQVFLLDIFFFFRSFLHIFAIVNELLSFSMSELPNIEYFWNVNIDESVNDYSCQIYIFVFFLYQGFLHRHWRFTEQQGKGGDHLLFHSTTSACSQTFRHLYIWNFACEMTIIITTAKYLQNNLFYLYNILIKWKEKY